MSVLNAVPCQENTELNLDALCDMLDDDDDFGSEETTVPSTTDDKKKDIVVTTNKSTTIDCQSSNQLSVDALQAQMLEMQKQMMLMQKQLEEKNIELFKKALTGGFLYNVGPEVTNGTEFSANRWQEYIDCVGSKR